MEVTIVGMGCPGEAFPMGSLTGEAVRALTEAELLVGPARLVEAAGGCPGRRVAAALPREIMEVLKGEAAARAAVLFSGDTGFFSGAAGLARSLEEDGIPFRILPGISSLQLFSARLGKPWQDWALLSAHGVKADPVLELVLGRRPLFFLTGGGESLRELLSCLVKAGLGAVRVSVGENLGTSGERIREDTAENFLEEDFAQLQVCLLEAPAELLPERRTPGIPDSAFTRGEVPMTKQEVRAAILAKLGLLEREVCWDIGSGTGSVAVEMALAGARAYAVERGEEGLALIRANREKFRAWNLCPVAGTAPEALGGLPRPDAVFVGGSGGRLPEILAAAEAANPDVRLCVSAISLETLEEALRWMENRGFAPEVSQIQVSRSRRAGTLHLMMANNPVFLISGRRE